mmetsp:Transcript_9597/g.16495  ORF Transcript_9597/g.16495 Transcript_9597/m.16495 type:complete len:123 (+) Transcript_9597:346-714(+)
MRTQWSWRTMSCTPGPNLASVAVGQSCPSLPDLSQDCYLPDLKQMEAQGLLHANTMVVADNVVYPGAPGFLEYVDSSMGRYKTYLEPAKFEYDQKWKPDWVPQEDAISVSVFQFQLSNKEDC